MEGVRTNAICMILHVLARPGCAHRVSAFCLRFPLAFLAAVTQPPRNEGGGERRRRRRRKGLRAAASSCARGRRDGRREIIFLGFSRRNSGISMGSEEERRKGEFRGGGSFGLEGNYREKLALPSRTDDE